MRDYRPLAIVTGLLCLAAVPALLGLLQTARGYLDTTHAIATLRFEIVEIGPADGPGGPVPAVTLRVRGVERTSLTLAEVAFDLEWQGRRVASGREFPRATLTPGSDTTVTVPTVLNPDFAAETRALLARGEAPFRLNGRARVLLPRGDVAVWLTLRGSRGGG